MKILSIRQKDFEKQADKNYSASPEIVEVEICNRQFIFSFSKKEKSI